MDLRQHGTQVVICMRRDDTEISHLASTDPSLPCLAVVLFVVVFGFVFASGSLCFGFCSLLT